MKKKSKIDKLKAGVAGLLLGATLVTGVGCAKQNKAETTTDNVKVTETHDLDFNEIKDAASVRNYLTKAVNKTFKDYVLAQGGEQTESSDGLNQVAIGCITAPNGESVAWMNGEYYSIYSQGQNFTSGEDYFEGSDAYISLKDALLEIINDENHIVIITDNSIKIDDNDCNVTEFKIKNGKIVEIKDVYTEFKTQKQYESSVTFAKSNEKEFNQRLNDAIKDIQSANEYFNGLTK